MLEKPRIPQPGEVLKPEFADVDPEDVRRALWSRYSNVPGWWVEATREGIAIGGLKPELVDAALADWTPQRYLYSQETRDALATTRAFAARDPAVVLPLETAQALQAVIRALSELVTVRFTR